MINVMTYDLYGSWHNKIGHHSALFHRDGETGMERELNTVCYRRN
jgi:GH18 family chitinase